LNLKNIIFVNGVDWITIIIVIQSTPFTKIIFFKFK